MAKTARRKASYGGCTIGRFSPAVKQDWPKVINVTLSFEEALKLNLAIQARLLDINRLNRATKAGKAAALNLSIFTEGKQIAVNPDTLK